MTNAQNTSWHSPPKVWAKLRSPARELRRAATPEEDLVWERVRGRRFHGLRFRRQHALGSFIVDFYCPEKHLIIEVDGGIHQTSVETDRALTKLSTVLPILSSPREERGRG